MNEELTSLRQWRRKLEAVASNRLVEFGLGDHPENTHPVVGIFGLLAQYLKLNESRWGQNL